MTGRSSERTILHKRILELLSDGQMTINELQLHTHSSDMGIRSALRAMVQRGELWRTVRKDKVQMFQVTPLQAKFRG